MIFCFSIPFNPEKVFSPRPQLSDQSRASSYDLNTSAFEPMYQDFGGLSLEGNDQPTSTSMLVHLDPTSAPPSAPSQPPPPPAPPPLHSAGQDMIFQPHSAYPLQYHLYAPTPERIRHSLKPHQRLVEDFFVSNDIREELQRKNEASLQKLPGSSLPDYVSMYHSLVPLDINFDRDDETNLFFGYPTWAYKAVSNNDGRIYCLRRVEGFRLTNERAITTVTKLWKNVSSPSLVRLHECFTTRAFGDNSLILVYDYHPLSVTLNDYYFSSKSYYNRAGGAITEEVIWGYTVQLVSVIKTLHGSNIAVRCIDLSKIILTGQGRIRLNCCGIFDILQFDENTVQTNEELKLVDLEKLGKIILSLACNSTNLLDLDQCLQYVSLTYNDVLRQLLDYLLAEDNGNKTIDQVVQIIAVRTMENFNSALVNNDVLCSELNKEVENGRLVRLLCKFGFINERPEYNHDSNWSESGDRYLIKLFRDYVFHQVDEYGKPVIDLGHVLTTLNKLDCGIDESIMLVSRDEQNCLIVTYKELKKCMESAFRDLSR